MAIRAGDIYHLGMSTSASSPLTIDLPGTISALLGRVRSRVRWYTVISGLLVVATIAAAVFWLTLTIDTGWFALQKLELPVGLRAMLLCVMAVGLVSLLVMHVFAPVARRMNNADVAVLLERKFPEFKDRLLTTVQVADGYPESGPVVEQLLIRTVKEADDVASDVKEDDLFDLQALKKKGWIAGLLLLSIGGCGAVSPDSLTRWWKAFIQCDAVYHDRTTTLEFAVLAQPGDRRRELDSSDGRLAYKHASGEDFELHMTVPEGDSPSGKPWVIPDRVRVDVRRADGTSSRTYVSPVGGNVFRFILTRLQETVSIEVRAGDFRTASPIVISSVEPPTIDSMIAVCQYPEYTRWNVLRGSLAEILGSEVALPLGTTFDLEVTSNKSLQGGKLFTDEFEITGDRETAMFVARETGEEVSLSQPLLSEDGMTVRLPLELTLPEKIEGLPANGAIQISPNTSLKFFLHDDDDIMSTTPESLRVRGIEDKAPIIATQTQGVGNAITRRAIIPMTGTITDDYGMDSAGYEFILDDGSEWRARAFRDVVTSGVTEYELSTDKAKPERFDVKPLELSEGQTLSLSIVATDACTQPEPHKARSEPLVFRIVSDQELLSLLYTREVNLRRQFEEAIQKMKQVQSDLEFHREIAERLEAGSSPAKTVQDRASVAQCARRSGDSIRRQANSLQAVHLGFEEIVAQLLNNEIPPAILAENMRKGIVVPLNAAVEGSMVRADRAVSEYRVTADAGTDCLSQIEASERQVSVAIKELETILASVRDLAEFHEVLNDLNDLLEEHKRIQQETIKAQLGVE